MNVRRILGAPVDLTSQIQSLKLAMGLQALDLGEAQMTIAAQDKMIKSAADAASAASTQAAAAEAAVSKQSTTKAGRIAAKAIDTLGTLVYVTDNGLPTGTPLFPNGFAVILTCESPATTAIPPCWPTYSIVDSKSFRVMAWRIGTLVNLLSVRSDATVSWVVRQL